MPLCTARNYRETFETSESEAAVDDPVVFHSALSFTDRVRVAVLSGNFAKKLRETHPDNRNQNQSYVKYVRAVDLDFIQNRHFCSLLSSVSPGLIGGRSTLAGRHVEEKILFCEEVADEEPSSSPGILFCHMSFTPGQSALISFRSGIEQSALPGALWKLNGVRGVLAGRHPIHRRSGRSHSVKKS